MKSFHVHLLFMFFMCMIWMSYDCFVNGGEIIHRRRIEDKIYLQSKNETSKTTPANVGPSSQTPFQKPKERKKKVMPDWAWAVLGIGILLVIIGGIVAYIVINSKEGKIGSMIESSVPTNIGTPDTSKSKPVSPTGKPKKLWKPSSDKYLKNMRSTEY